GCRGLVGALLWGADVPPPPLAPEPDENDRYLVHDADFSQARVVWQARMPPGLVVHGPPGTGKSQTIVNIIADALAHDRTILMVCQKQAATNVVLERLRAVGLHDLCLEVHDAAGNRQEVFRKIRDQVDQLKPSYSNYQEARPQLARQIQEKERILDEHAQALHEKHTRIGLSYKQILAREASLRSEFPNLRELPSLCKVVENVSIDELNELSPHVQ